MRSTVQLVGRCRRFYRVLLGSAERSARVEMQPVPRVQSLSLPDSLSWRSFSETHCLVFSTVCSTLSSRGRTRVTGRRRHATSWISRSSGFFVKDKNEQRQLLTQRAQESCAALRVAAAADERHAVIGRRGRSGGCSSRRSALVLGVAAAVLAAGGRGAVGVGGAVAAAQLVHNSSLRHQLCGQEEDAGDHHRRELT